ncbi:hypothetical protein EON66_01080 [archaeon]|nr:MAG: hypothetical protein EON66_01080 [archaeon]
MMIRRNAELQLESVHALRDAVAGMEAPMLGQAAPAAGNIGTASLSQTDRVLVDESNAAGGVEEEAAAMRESLALSATLSREFEDLEVCVRTLACRHAHALELFRCIACSGARFPQPSARPADISEPCTQRLFWAHCTLASTLQTALRLSMLEAEERRCAEELEISMLEAAIAASLAFELERMRLFEVAEASAAPILPASATPNAVPSPPPFAVSVRTATPASVSEPAAVGANTVEGSTSPKPPPLPLSTTTATTVVDPPRAAVPPAPSVRTAACDDLRVEELEDVTVAAGVPGSAAHRGGASMLSSIARSAAGPSMLGAKFPYVVQLHAHVRHLRLRFHTDAWSCRCMCVCVCVCAYPWEFALRTTPALAVIWNSL